jgi:hypothetical protein
MTAPMGAEIPLVIDPRTEPPGYEYICTLLLSLSEARRTVVDPEPKSANWASV